MSAHNTRVSAPSEPTLIADTGRRLDNAQPCERCGHRYLDHAPNWMVVPALSPCSECDCPEFVGEQSDGSIAPGERT